MCEVTVIVLGFNGRHILERSLAALLDQDLTAESEIIYADNASNDGSADYVQQRFPSIRVLSFDRNLGFAEGNNRAVLHARGRFIVFVNQDVIVHRHCLSALVAPLAADERLGASQANLGSDPGIVPARVRVTDVTRYGFAASRLVPPAGSVVPTRFISGACFAIDRRVVAELGYLFDPTFFMYGEDLDLALRLSARGYTLAVAPDAIAWHLRDRRPLAPSDVVRAYRATRNRLVAYRKNTPGPEFRRFLPWLIAGAPLKAFTTGGSRARQLLLFGALIPITVVAAAAAMLRRGRRE